MKEWRLASSEEINNMTFDEAKEIIKRMIDLGHRTGDFRPREHFTKAMEIILEKAEVNHKTKQNIICEHFQTDDQDEHLVTSENVAEHSFICNACVYFDVNSNKELDATKCENCNGQGREWQPRNKELYEKDPLKFMEHLLLGSI